MTVPLDVREAALGAFDLHDPSRLVAALIFDSLVDGPPTVRSAPRRLTFECRSNRVELSVRENPEGRVLHVRVASMGPVVVTLLRPSASTEVRTDDRGYSTVQATPGLISLLICDLPDQPDIRTAWVTI